MEVTVFNNKDTKISFYSDVNRLWASVLFADKVYLNTPNSFSMDFHNFCKSLTFERKYKFYNILYENHHSVSKEEVDKFNEKVENFIKTRKKRGKNSKQLIAEKKFERFLVDFYEKGLENYAEIIAEEYKFETLRPFVKGEERIIFPEWSGDHENKNDIKKKITADVYNSFNRITNFVFLDENILTLCNCKLMDKKNSSGLFKKKKINCIGYPLYKIPSLQSLDFNQLNILRNDFRQKLRPLLLNLVDLNEQFRSIEYSKSNIDSIYNLFKQQIIDHQDGLQSELDSNVYIEMLNSRNADNKNYMVNVGISSYNNLVDLYKTLNFIDDNLGVFVKEKLQKDVDLNACTMFLYLTEV